MTTYGLQSKSSNLQFRLLINDPDAILEVHRRYINAGADIIVTTSYQASLSGFIKSGLSELDSIKLMQSSTSIAFDACRNWSISKQVKVACSIGSFGALLADGSEFTGIFQDPPLQFSKEMIISSHAEKISILLSHHVVPDIIMFETIPSLYEVNAIVDIFTSTNILKKFDGKEIHVSLCSLDGVNVCHGESINSCVKSLLKINNNPSNFILTTIGVNCVKPCLVSSLIREIKQALEESRNSSIAISVKPNSGEEWCADTHQWKSSGTPDIICKWEFWTQEWISLGATLIGGCCRTTPAHIEKIRKVVDRLAK